VRYLRAHENCSSILHKRTLLNHSYSSLGIVAVTARAAVVVLVAIRLAAHVSAADVTMLTVVTSLSVKDGT
jgi:hypothetical protein